MNRKQQSVLLAGLLALVLAGCSSTRGGSEEMGGATGSGMGTSGASGSMGSGAAGGTSGGTAATGGYDTQGGTAGTASGSTAAPAPAQGAAGSSMMPGGMPNGVVMTIEVVPRQGAAGAGGVGAVGGSGTAGTTGSSMGDEKMYRITLRMDDGSTRVVTQDKAPTFRSGDRVNMTDGMITQ
jgi:hypothetical protein